MSTKFDIPPGSGQLVSLPVARLYTHNDLSIDVQAVRGKRKGPTLFVSAAIHGDEINGVEIVRRLLQHPRSGLAHRILDHRRILLCGRQRTEVDAVHCGALLRQLRAHHGMDLGQPRLGQLAASDHRLVGDNDNCPARRAQIPHRRAGAWDQADVARVGQVMHQLDQRAVAVKEDGPLHARSPGASALARASASGEPMSR